MAENRMLTPIKFDTTRGILKVRHIPCGIVPDSFCWETRLSTVEVYTHGQDRYQSIREMLRCYDL